MLKIIMIMKLMMKKVIASIETTHLIVNRLKVF
jgi:hypothetical protein